VTAALLSAALAVVLWPDRRALRRERLVAVTGGQGGGPGRHGTRVRVPIPVVAATAAVAVAAAVSTLLVAVLAGFVAAVVARAWGAGRRAAETDARLAAVAEGLGAIAAELRSGRSVDAATAAAVTACEDESTGRALARAVRVPGVPSAGDHPGTVAAVLDRVSAAAALSGRTGCSLAALLAAVQDDLSARRRTDRDLRSSTAGPRASAALLAGLPLLGVAMGSGVGADPWGVLTTTSTGQVLLVAGVGLEMAGLAWTRWLLLRATR
jgi:tight adherence protein B